MIDPFGDEFKAIEAEWKQVLPSNSYYVCRVDGRAFHTYTRGLDQPFDWNFIHYMNETARFLCKEVSGSICAYTQSDKISIVFSDLASPQTQAYFGGVIQKIVSNIASIAGVVFNQTVREYGGYDFGMYPKHPAFFDARVFPLETKEQVGKYLDWRQSDCFRNCVSILCHHHLGKKVVLNKSTKERIEMLKEINVIVDNLEFQSRGRLTIPYHYNDTTTYMNQRTGEEKTVDFVRSEWQSGTAPKHLGDWFVNSQ